MNLEKPNQNFLLNLEGAREVFQSFKNSGVSAQTYYELQQGFLNGELKSYQETYEQSKGASIIIEDNNEKLLTNKEIGEYIDSKFQGDILRKALVKNIEIRFGEVNYQAPKENLFGIEQGEYYFPKELFSGYFDKLSSERQAEISTNIYHAESFANWNRITDERYEMVKNALSDSGNVFPTPVVLFNLEFDKESRAIKDGKLEQAGLDYLEQVEEIRRQKVYALGTIAHELAHNIFQHLIYKKPNMKEWEEIIGRTGGVTKYTERYKNDLLTYYDENFSESIRLFTTTIEFLEKEKYAEVIRFIEKYFPEIKSN